MSCCAPVNNGVDNRTKRMGETIEQMKAIILKNQKDIFVHKLVERFRLLDTDNDLKVSVDPKLSEMLKRLNNKGNPFDETITDEHIDEWIEELIEEPRETVKIRDCGEFLGIFKAAEEEEEESEVTEATSDSESDEDSDNEDSDSDDSGESTMDSESTEAWEKEEDEMELTFDNFFSDLESIPKGKDVFLRFYAKVLKNF